MTAHRQHVPLATLNQLTQSESIEVLPLTRLIELFKSDLKNDSHPQSPCFQVDPRNDEPVVFNPGRALRPNGYATCKPSSQKKACPICEGRTTGIIDIAPLSEGYTFINKNLYPMVTPYHGSIMQGIQIDKIIEPKVISGFHFLQWTSSFHDNDWQNMPIEDGNNCIAKAWRTGEEITFR